MRLNYDLKEINHFNVILLEMVSLLLIFLFAKRNFLIVHMEKKNC